MPREVIDYAALAERLEADAAEVERNVGSYGRIADLRTAADLIERMAQEPVAWVHPMMLERGALGIECSPIQLGPQQIPLYAAPQPEPVSDPRPCTCHPDDNPPVLCARQYALNECGAASEPTEAQIEAWQLLADLVAGLEATHWSSWQTTAHFDSALNAARAALAAKETK